jgi:hypothetical protein
VEEWSRPFTPDSGPWPGIAASCSAVVGLGLPGVRLEQFTRSFGDNGLVYSFCNNDYGPQLQEIGSKIVSVLDGSRRVF